MTDSTYLTTPDAPVLPPDTELPNYVERWEQALRLLENLTPDERVKNLDISHWGYRAPCGTLAGLCSVDPWFQARGFTSELAPNETGLLKFTNQSPEDFFGDIATDFIFLGGRRRYEDLVLAVKQHLQYLKAGGDANFTDDEDDCPEDDQDGDPDQDPDNEEC